MGGRIRRTPRSRRQQRHRWQKEQQALVQSADDSDSDGQKEQTSPPTQLPLKMRFKGGGVINGNGGGSSSGGGNTLPSAASVPVSPSPSALPASPSLASQKQTHLRKKCGGGGSRLKRKPHKLKSLQSCPDCTTSQHPTASVKAAEKTGRISTQICAELLLAGTLSNARSR